MHDDRDRTGVDEAGPGRNQLGIGAAFIPVGLMFIVLGLTLERRTPYLALGMGYAGDGVGRKHAAPSRDRATLMDGERHAGAAGGGRIRGDAEPASELDDRARALADRLLELAG
ncbi:hypothetical protein ACFUMH_03690 [Cellulomonas sp. NPDC057328]|uniref:hypothetical protein n=1 Tax=Cellulomonas sp. NPDC057328 TaxID=3346101 RepID=UPI003631E247